MKTPNATHGTIPAYRRGCRCDLCRAAKSAQNAIFRVRAQPVDDLALTGGQWVPRDGIMRWERAS